MIPFSLIVAEEYETHGIGKSGSIPWKIPQDLLYFKKITTEVENSVVIMGRKTWDSLPLSSKPLPNRINMILSSTLSSEITNVEQSVYVFATLDEIWRKVCQLMTKVKLGKIFVIGGSRLFDECAQSPWCESIYLTQITNHNYGAFDCDTFWKGVPEDMFEKLNTIHYRHSCYDVSSSLWFRKKKVEHPETQYLNLVERVLKEGTKRTDRTGVGTLSIFGAQMRFDLGMGFPLFTTKNVFWKGVRDELLWFIHGDTNSKSLSEKGVHIWDGNGTREFLDKRGLFDNECGDLGPVYGFQWRHFGADYDGPISTKDPSRYVGKGIDQLRECINLIKNDPDSRRIIMSAWNPIDLPKMALPPCHVMCQFYVSEGRLSCQMYQRSADLMLGVPFNVASYALLTTIMAHCCDLKVGDFIHTIGDAHIYLTHVDGAKEQIQRKPLTFPTVQLNPEKKDVDAFVASDFKLCDYMFHPTIKFPMAV